MSPKLARSSKNQGITLVELLVVIVAIGIIAAILLPAVGRPHVQSPSQVITPVARMFPTVMVQRTTLAKKLI